MFVDQVGCEWVSVSSGTGLPGLSRTKAVKRLCVCVCVQRLPILIQWYNAILLYDSFMKEEEEKVHSSLIL